MNNPKSPLESRLSKIAVTSFKNKKGGEHGNNSFQLDCKDKFGASTALREKIESKYELMTIVGKGSYGCVTKAKCKITGQLVAIKIMENHTDTEYDTIKILREVLIMKKMN